MAVDMKRLIALETQKLIYENKVEKLTVKDIVDACHITRQAFYYHFANIPELLKWILEERSNELFLEFENSNDIEGQIRYLLLFSINAQPVLKKGLESKYGIELEDLLIQNMEKLLHRLVEKEGGLKNCTPFEQKVIIQYHCQAMIGIMRHWSYKDSKRVDEIAHGLFLTITKGFLL